jgi:predicted signal transduction protein with EAL and GGDEF domain
MRPDRQQRIRSLFDEYIEMYASRDDRLTARFSENFSGCTGGGDFLVKDRDAWVKITRQDFAQVPDRIRIEMLDLSTQDISDDVVVVSALFHIHLPIPEHILSREMARLVLIFRLEGEEFVVLLPNTNGQNALESARRIQRDVCLLALPHADTSPGVVTFSLGVASLVPSAAHTAEYLVQQADSALYRAKQSGRNCVQSAAD